MNAHDSERIKGMLEELGLGEAPTAEDADVVVFNTCTIREKPDTKLAAYLGAEAARKRAEPLAEMRDRPRPEGDIDERVPLEDALALRLRVAAADGDDEVRPVPLPGSGVPEVRGEARVRLLADRAGVEDENVGVR